nr:MAG TPA: hypothetical protein [Caudoviricetes sp.]
MHYSMFLLKNASLNRKVISCYVSIKHMREATISSLLIMSLSLIGIDLLTIASLQHEPSNRS